MGEIVNWFLLLIIFVFDPLAIALVVAANFAFSQTKPKEKESSNDEVNEKETIIQDIKIPEPVQSIGVEPIAEEIVKEDIYNEKKDEDLSPEQEEGKHRGYY